MDITGNYPEPVDLESDIIYQKGRDGEVLLSQIKVQGCVIPAVQVIRRAVPDPRSHVPTIKDMEMYEDDVIICAHPKSGTHWLWEVTNMIVKRKAEYETFQKSAVMLEFNNLEDLGHWARPRVFNTHLPVHVLPRQALMGKCKMLFILRNPKDIVVSHYNHVRQIVRESDGRWEEYFSLFLEGRTNFGPWAEYVKGFEKIINEENSSDWILPLYFEDLKTGPVSEIQKIAQFLNVDIDESLSTEIAEKCSFQNMKEADKTKKELNKKGPRDIYRKGDVGDWKNWFTVAQNEMFDDMIEKKMKDCTFKFKYSSL